MTNKEKKLKIELSDEELENVVGGIYLQTIANFAAKFLKDKIDNLISSKNFSDSSKTDTEGR